jgi:NTE family protein
VEGQRTLFAQGDKADGMYIVLQGRLRAVRTDTDGREHVLGEVGRGGYVGELALLLGATRSATVRAVRDGTLLHLSDAGFRELVNRHPSAAMDVARTLARRADAAHRQVAMDAFRTIAVLPISAGARAGAVTDELIAALSAEGTTAVVRMPASGAEVPAEQLTRMEQDHDQVVYVGEWSEPRWAQRCLRQADMVLLVACGDEPPCPPPEWLHGFSIPTHLALLHSSPDLPRGTAAWLAMGTYRAHHHVRRGENADVQRMARVLCGRAVGLALSGGGSRTTAYIGVFKALQAHGVKPDIVAGTSGGAMLGAMYALRMDPQTMLENIRGLGKAPFYLDLGPPMVSMLGGRVLNRMLRSFYGDYGIEDTPLTMMPVCASLGKSGPFVPSTGPLWRAVQASSAVPGVFPPVAWDGDLLVDGGIVDNLPVDVLLAGCSRGRILAADVSAAPRFPPSSDDLHSTGGWTALWRRWTGAARAPALLDILQTSACIASNALLTRTLQHVHLHIQPLPNGVPASGDPLDAMVESGYRETMAALERVAVTST